jgi:hypothetical protein
MQHKPDCNSALGSCIHWLPELQGSWDLATHQLYIRVQTGALGKDHAIELADAIRALDKLDHCHDALSHAAGMIQAFFSFVYTCFTFATLHICFRKECGVELHVLLHSH